MRIIFAGTPEPAACALTSLLASNPARRPEGPGSHLLPLTGERARHQP